MEIPGPREREDLERLELVYDAGGAIGPVAALEILTAAGVDFEVAQHWILATDRRGLTEEFEGAVVSERQLTQAGREAVERARARRADRSYLRRATMSRLLLWADAEGANITAFPTTPYAWVDGATLTFEQAAEAAAALHQDGLVKANVITAWGGDVVRADVTILPAGRVCIDDYDADVQAYRASRSEAGSQTVHISQHAGSIAVGGHGSTVAATFEGLDAQALRQLAEALLSARTVLGLGPEAAADLDEHAAALREASDVGRVRQALQWISAFATSASAGALGGVLGAQALRLLGQM